MVVENPQFEHHKVINIVSALIMARSRFPTTIMVTPAVAKVIESPMLRGRRGKK